MNTKEKTSTRNNVVTQPGPQLELPSRLVRYCHFGISPVNYSDSQAKVVISFLDIYMRDPCAIEAMNSGRLQRLLSNIQEKTYEACSTVENTGAELKRPGMENDRVGRQGTLLCKEINIGYL